jgi:glycosyltransferase involved in cell wall biosynthesis
LDSGKKLLVIGKVWPEPISSAAGTRILQIISIFKENGFSITFSSAAKKSEFSADLDKMGSNEQPIELNNSTFDVFIQELKPDVVLFDRYMIEEQFGWRVSEIVPDAIRILDTEDLHFLREARKQCYEDQKQSNTEFYPYLNNNIMKRELASIMRCDFSIMISSFEIDLLKKEFNVSESKILFLPLLIDNEIEETKLNQFHKRNHFVTIGNFLHPPNWDSVLFLKEKIWPVIHKALPSAEIHIYGAYPDQKVWNLHNKKEGFIIKGRCDDVRIALPSYRVMLAPLQFGAGQKGKLLDAFVSDLPSVTTSIGAEAMGFESDWPGFISDDVDDFIRKGILLNSDESVWVEKASKSAEIIKSNFDYSKYSKQFWIDLMDKFERIEESRSKDYYGNVLNYQTNHASKYLSKWIEEKNRKLDQQ